MWSKAGALQEKPGSQAGAWEPEGGLELGNQKVGCGVSWWFLAFWVAFGVGRASVPAKHCLLEWAVFILVPKLQLGNANFPAKLCFATFSTFSTH
jgi:hypothetical protein